MKKSIWIFALVLPILAMVVPAPSQGKDCCPCRTPKRRKARVSVRATPPKSALSQPIVGGKSAQQAVSIEPNRIYKINHPLRKGLRDYFSLSLEPGTELTLAMKSLKKADVGLEIIDPKDRSVAALTLGGEVNEVKRVSWRPLATGRYLVTVASAQGTVPKGRVIFKAETAPAPVACAEAGEGTPSLDPDAPHEDCFWKDDTTDRFRFDGYKRDVYRIEIASSESTAAVLRAKVGQERKKRGPKILADVSGSGGKVAVESVVLPKKGVYSLEVDLLEPSTDVLPYTVTFTRTSAREERAPRRHHHVDRPHY